MPDPSSPLPGRQVKRPDYSLPTGLTTTLSRGVTGGSITAGLPVSLSCPTRYGLGFRGDIAARRPARRRHTRSGRPGLGPNVWLHITRSYRAVNRPLSSRALPAFAEDIRAERARRCTRASAPTRACHQTHDLAWHCRQRPSPENEIRRDAAGAARLGLPNYRAGRLCTGDGQWRGHSRRIQASGVVEMHDQFVQPGGGRCNAPGLGRSWVERVSR